MAEKYETRPFEYVNNKDCRFYEASVNGKYLYQEFLLGLKDKKNDLRKLNSIYAYMDQFGALLLPKTKFRYIGTSNILIYTSSRKMTSESTSS